jgi:hypothetical protein
MAEHVQRVEYYYATLDDTPGTGARVMSTLKDAGVNLLAFLAFPVAGKKSQLDLVERDEVGLLHPGRRPGWGGDGDHQPAGRSRH